MSYLVKRKCKKDIKARLKLFKLLTYHANWFNDKGDCENQKAKEK